VALLLLTLASPASAQDSPSGGGGLDAEAPFDITAESIEYERERSLYIARGNVLITQPGRSLTADWVAFSDETRLGVATGNVVLSEADDTLYADVLSFEVDNLEGIVLEGILDARGSGFEMTGETIRKTGEQTYSLDDCTFTTCRCPQEGVEPWEIRAKKADIEVGGYATTRNTSFHILGVPVLWLPWMRYPVKTERETGFLLPTFSASSRSGGDFGLPFFWAALPNLNVTITPSYIGDRGFKPNLDIEYVFGERSYGTLYGTFIDDKDVDEDDPDTPFDSKRWGVEWLHDQFLPGGWRLKVDAKAVSDNLFPWDFSDFGSYDSDRYLESVGFVEKRFGPLERYGFTGGVRWAEDLQNPDDQDRDRFLLQRLPDLQLVGLPQPLQRLDSRLYASFGVDYTHFYSRKKASDEYPDYVVGDDLFLDTGIDAIPDQEEFPRGPDPHRDNFDPPLDKFGPEDDGIFQEGELLGDRGHRLALNPRIGIPFRIADLVEVLPEFGYHGTFYLTEAQSPNSRSLFTAMLDSRIRLRRELDLPFGRGKAVHLMEPRLVYTGVTSASQSDNPLFIPRTGEPQERIRQFELFNVTRNPSDRIDSVNAITAGLGNRFYVSGAQGGPPKLFADVAFSTQYDFSNDDNTKFFVEGTVYPYKLTHVRFNMGYDLRQTELSEGLFEFGYRAKEGHDLGVSYRYLRDTPRFFEDFKKDDRYDEFETGFKRINQITAMGRLALTRNWALTYRGQYSFENSIFLSNRAGVEYISKCRCWAIRLEVADNRVGGVDFNVQYILIGLGDDDIRPFAADRRYATRDPSFGERR